MWWIVRPTKIRGFEPSQSPQLWTMQGMHRRHPMLEPPHMEQRRVHIDVLPAQTTDFRHA
jgi:hypothetical protein